MDPQVITDFLIGTSSEMAVALTMILLMWLRSRVNTGSILKRILYARIKRKKYVLVWNDDDPGISRLINKKLGEHEPDYNYRELTNPDEILRYPLSPKHVQLLILIITDVTKLAEDQRTRELIQNRILRFVDEGGVVIGTHDIIYKRVRNDILQRAFGGKITNFRRESSPIDYLVVEEQKDHPLLAGLPPEFALEDGEVCWGSWAPDVTPLIVTKHPYDGDRQVPLLTIRSYSRGMLVWMSSCDKFEHLGRSIAEPQPEFVQILLNVLRGARHHIRKDGW